LDLGARAWEWKGLLDGCAVASERGREEEGREGEKETGLLIRHRNI
jgi:hypothetical protein